MITNVTQSWCLLAPFFLFNVSQTAGSGIETHIWSEKVTSLISIFLPSDWLLCPAECAQIYKFNNWEATRQPAVGRAANTGLITTWVIQLPTDCTLQNGQKVRLSGPTLVPHRGTEHVQNVQQGAKTQTFPVGAGGDLRAVDALGELLVGRVLSDHWAF